MGTVDDWKFATKLSSLAGGKWASESVFPAKKPHFGERHFGLEKLVIIRAKMKEMDKGGDINFQLSPASHSLMIHFHGHFSTNSGDLMQFWTEDKKSEEIFPHTLARDRVCRFQPPFSLAQLITLKSMGDF